MTLPALSVILPLMLLLGAAVIGLLLRRYDRVQRWGSVCSMAGFFGLSLLLLWQVNLVGIIVVQVGGWPAPFGITLVADHFSAIMIAASAFTAFVVSIYMLIDLDLERVRLHVHPLFNILMLGICGSFLAGDLFNLYVWFEVLLISSFILLAIGNRAWQLEGALKYAAINLLGSIFFLAGIAFLYGMTGTLNMADLAVRLPLVEAPRMVTAVAMIFIVAFGIKAAIFPLFFWLPAAYHTPPVSISAIFAGLMSKVGVYALIRAFTLFFVHDLAYTHVLLLWLAGLTMLTGVLGALVQPDLRRILSFHIISQIGYMVMGLALFTPLALIGAVWYIVHNMFVKTTLFLVAGVAAHLGGTESIKNLGGLYKHYPLVSIFFIIPAFALAGFPPLSGFWGKLMLARAGLAIDQYAIVAVSLTVGLLTLCCMAKIWLTAFLPDRASAHASPAAARQTVRLLLVPVAMLTAATLAMSVFAGPCYELAARAAEELLNPTYYITAVLGHE